MAGSPGRRSPECFRLVKIDYLVVVNDTAAQAVLEASSRFSATTGG
jgi:hypothetical protein